jgi:hypothetical protein
VHRTPNGTGVAEVLPGEPGRACGGDGDHHQDHEEPEPGAKHVGVNPTRTGVPVVELVSGRARPPWEIAARPL